MSWGSKMTSEKRKKQLIHFIFLQETYPATPPVWFADSEETSVTNAVQILSNTSGAENHIVNQVGILLRELCRLHGVQEPPDMTRLTLPIPVNTRFQVKKFFWGGS